MKFWQSTAFTNPTELPAIAKGAEEAGFDGILVSEHLFVPAEFKAAYPYNETGVPDFNVETPFPDPWVAITAMAAVTEKIRFTTMVNITPLYHPLALAKAVGSAAIFSNDRVILGAGAGWMREEFDVLGTPFEKRGKRFNEMFEVMRKVWGGGVVEHHGEHFDFPPLAQSPAPSKPVPIYVGGASKPALRRAATLGDGWLGAGNMPEDAAEILKTLRSLREEAGRADEPFETVVPLAVPPDPQVLGDLSKLGADGTVNYPFLYTCGPDASLQQKLDMMGQYGEGVIKHMKDL
jgi:probable F420-dependent oxidoreductase